MFQQKRWGGAEARERDIIAGTGRKTKKQGQENPKS